MGTSAHGLCDSFELMSLLAFYYRGLLL